MHELTVHLIMQTNTVMGSPASSLRADGPPSPLLRDAFLATQEWRNKEAMISNGRKRPHRPGVTFDCPDDIPPIDIAMRPKMQRVGTGRGYGSYGASYGTDEEDEEFPM